MKTKNVKSLLLVLSMLVTESTWADWVKIDWNEKTTAYIDPTTIRKEGTRRKVWGLNDYTERAERGGLSVRFRTEYDCSKESGRTLTITTFSGNMATGEIISNQSFVENSWRDIAPETIDDSLLKAVCTK